LGASLIDCRIQKEERVPFAARQDKSADMLGTAIITAAALYETAARD